MTDANFAVFVIVIVALFLLWWWFASGQPTTKRTPTADAPSVIDPIGREESEAISRHFSSVLFTKTEEQREEIISLTMAKHGCGKVQAMKIAIEEWIKDETRFD